MKRLFLWLIAINLTVAAVIWLREAPAENTRLKQQLTPDKIRPLSPEQAEALRRSSSKATPATTPVSSASADPPVCFEWRKLSPADAPRAETALASLQRDNWVEKREEEFTSGYWVLVPPLKTREDAQAKLEEVRGLGVADGYVIEGSSKWRNAISLGTFKSEESARRHLAEMQRKGIAPADVSPRTQPTGYAFIIRGDVGLEPELAQIRRQFPESKLQKVGCR